MLPRTDFPTYRASLASVGRWNERRSNTDFGRLVSDEILQLPERPAVKPRPRPPAGFDTATDVGEGLHCDRPGANADGLGDDLLARDVVDVPHVLPLFARDFPQKLFGASGAIGLETATQGEMAVTFVTKFPAAPNLASVDSGEVVFSDIQSNNRAGITEFHLHLDDEEPPALAEGELGLCWLAPGKQSLLVRAGSQGDQDAAAKRVQREAVALHGEGALHRCAAEVDGRDGLVLRNFPVRPHRPVGAAHSSQDIAAHLRAKRCLSTQAAVGQGVDAVAVPTPILDDHRDEHVAGVGVGVAGPKITEGRQCRGIGLDPDRGCTSGRRGFRLFGSLCHLSPLLHVFRPLNVRANHVRTNVAGGFDEIGRRPQMPGRQPAAQPTESNEQLSRRRSFQDFDRIRNGDSRPDGEKQVNGVRLDFLGDCRPRVFPANRMKRVARGLRNLTPSESRLSFGHHTTMAGRWYTQLRFVVTSAIPHGQRGACRRARSLAFLPRLKTRVSSEGFL